MSRGYRGDFGGRRGDFRGGGDFGRGGGFRGGRGDFGGRGGGRGGGRFEDGAYAFEPLGQFAVDRLPTEVLAPRSWAGKQKGEGFDSSKAPKKPAGNSGNKIDIITNMVPIAIPTAPKFQYQVTIEPELPEKRRRKRLVHTVLEAEMPRVKKLFDGENIAYLDEKPPGQGDTFAFTSTLTHGGAEHPYTVTFKLTQFSTTARLDKTAVTFFCTHFKQAVSKLPDRQLVGRDYFDFAHKIAVPEHSCILVPGVDMTIYLTESGPLLNADMMFKHIRTDSIYEIINKDYRGQDHALLEKQFVKKVAMKSYGDRGTFIIDAIRWDMNPSSTFQTKQGPTTYAAYFKKHYNLDNGDIDKPQPLLECISRTKRDQDGNPQVSHFIPALCQLTGATEDMKRDFRRGRDLIRHTALKPAARLQKLSEYFNTCVGHAGFKADLEEWGISLRPAMGLIPGRRLPTPQMKNGAGPIAVNNERESWDVKFEWPMFRSAEFKKWVVVLHGQSPPTREFVDILRNRMGPSLKVQFAEPKVFIVGSQRPNDYVDVLKNQVVPLGPDFILCVLPRKTEAPYRRVKEYLCTEAGIVSQFVTESNISTDALTKSTKIAVQMNCKAGGAPWATDCKFAVPTMVIGLDIHHGGDLEHRGGSVGAFVASLDKEVTKFYNRTFIMKQREGLFEPAPGQISLAQLTTAALDQFRKANGIFPQFVLVYRDGGSEGQIHHLVQHEVGEILKGINAKPECVGKCKLAYFSVLKGIRVRVFHKEDGGHGVSNPPPGTVVDTKITSNILSEFFLVAQSVNQGSATPTKYQLLYDDSPAALDNFEQWTYFMAHNYFNWFGTVRTPCVLKYASTLAKFSGSFLRGKEVKQPLWERLFYL